MGVFKVIIVPCVFNEQCVLKLYECAVCVLCAVCFNVPCVFK